MLALPFGLVLAACSPTFREEARVGGEFTVPPGTKRVVVDLPLGSVTVRGTDAGEAGVWEGIALRSARDQAGFDRLRDVSLDLTATVDGDVLRLSGPALPAGANPEQDHLVLKVVVDLPREIDVEARTTRGNLSIVDRRGAVRLEAGQGDLQAKDVHGTAYLRTGNGNCIVDAHHGELDVETKWGAIQCRVAAITGPVHLVTRSGQIQARLPEEGGFVLAAEISKGKAKNGFGLPVERWNQHGFTMEGPVGGGGPVVRVVTELGNASVSP